MVPVIRSCQSPTWIWLVKYLHLHPRRLCILLCRCDRRIWPGIRFFEFGDTAVATTCSFCQDHVFPFCPDFGYAPRAHAAREHRWRHMEHRLFKCPGVSGLDSCMAITLLRDDICRACSRSGHAEAVLRVAFPSSHVPLLLPRLVLSRCWCLTLLLPWTVTPLGT